jgi:hypothetical protein
MLISTIFTAHEGVRMRQRVKSSNPIVACQSKKSYASKAEAEDMATFLWYKKEIDLEVYRCQMCERWHLSSKKS